MTPRAGFLFRSISTKETEAQRLLLRCLYLITHFAFLLLALAHSTAPDNKKIYYLILQAVQR